MTTKFNKFIYNWCNTSKSNFFLKKNNLCLDIPKHGQLFFQDPSTRFLEFAIGFHHDVMLIMICFFCLVLWFIIRINFFFYKCDTFNEFLNSSDHFPHLYHKKKIAYKSHNTTLEILWTTIPALILVSIAIPSFNLLYFNNSEIMSTFTIRVTASQWFWSYSHPLKYNFDYEKVVFPAHITSYTWACDRISDGALMKGGRDMFFDHWLRSLTKEHNSGFYFSGCCRSIVTTVNEKFKYGQYVLDICTDLLKISSKSSEYSFDSNLLPVKSGLFRLLEVDNRLILPRNTHIRFLVTSNDVLHSWSIPSLGIKVDACPGRLNEVSAIIYRNSIFYGQCSEICGVLHGFMPIVIQTVNYLDYIKLQYLLMYSETF